MLNLEKKCITRRAAIGRLAAGAAMVAMPTVVRAQKISWIGGSGSPQSDFISQALDFYAARVKALTAGQIDIATHHAASLGGDRELIEGIMQGSVHVAVPGAAIVAGWYRPADVWIFPYLFKDVAHKDRVMTSIMGVYGDEVAKQAKLRPIGAVPRMPRQLSSNRLVKTPVDLKGMKIRVPETPLWKRTFERFGASPTPLPFPEVFQALKSGIIDGQENPLALTYNSGFFDVNRNFALTEHMIADNMVVLAESAYQGVSANHRKALNQAARDTEDEMRPKVIADDKRILALAKAKNIAINEVDKDAFRATLRGLDTEFAHVKPWVDRIAAIA